jgi:hypothetical protein
MRIFNTFVSGLQAVFKMDVHFLHVWKSGSFSGRG